MLVNQGRTCHELRQWAPLAALRPLLHGAGSQLHKHLQRVRAGTGLIAGMRGRQEAALHLCGQRAMALQQRLRQRAAQRIRGTQVLHNEIFFAPLFHMLAGGMVL